jgi:hypothetical protein
MTRAKDSYLLAREILINVLYEPRRRRVCLPTTVEHLKGSSVFPQPGREFEKYVGRTSFGS